MTDRDETAGAPAGAPAEDGPAQTRIDVSRGFGAWLSAHQTSLAFSSYQTGQLFLVGLRPDGKVSFNQQSYQRCMGVHYTPGRLYVGSLFQLWRLENMLKPGERANGGFDSVLVPRNAQTTG